MLMLIIITTILFVILGIDVCYELMGMGCTAMKILGAILLPTILLVYYYLIKLIIHLKNKDDVDV